MSNKSSGTGFERDFAEYMAEKGYWAHVFQDNRNGQPFDIILAKDGNTQAGDCKVCENDVFRLSRMEPNQISAMTRWVECGNGEPWYYILLERANQVFRVPFSKLLELKRSGQKMIDDTQIIQLGELLCNDWEKWKWK